MISNIFTSQALDEIKEICRSVISEQMKQPVPISVGTETDESRQKLQRIMAKEFVTVNEAACLLSVSDQHIRNLITKAKKGQAKRPIPYRDLDGVTTFRLSELLEWSEPRKLKKVS